MRRRRRQRRRRRRRLSSRRWDSNSCEAEARQLRTKNLEAAAWSSYEFAEMLKTTFTQLSLLLLLLQLGVVVFALPSSFSQDRTTEMLPTSSESPSTSPAAAAEEHFPAVAPPQAAEIALIESQTGLLQPPVNTEDMLRRRVVTYDQRQEGQYNIRGDLENFMILVIPSGLPENLSVYDLFSKSASRVASKSSGKRKHSHPSAFKSFFQRQQQMEQQQRQQHDSLQQSSRSTLPGGIPEFIEGRTPYHVDITAASEEHPRLHRQQVDVLPPQLFSMPQLIKPFHLEAEPELIQALPPVPATSSSNTLLDGFNQANSQYYRDSRSLRGDSFLETNRLANEFVPNNNARAINVPLYRSDLAPNPSMANVLYPPIDAPAYIVNEAQPRNWQLSDEPTPILPKHLVNNGDALLSFELLGDALADSKTLLRDGLARCSPGQRRDSYGTCRQIEGY